MLLLTPAKKVFYWYTRQNPVELWLKLLRNAETFEDWEEAALHLDNLLGLDLWCVRHLSLCISTPFMEPVSSAKASCTNSMCYLF